jgi:hypothetical protein
MVGPSASAFRSRSQTTPSPLRGPFPSRPYYCTITTLGQGELRKFLGYRRIDQAPGMQKNYLSLGLQVSRVWISAPKGQQVPCQFLDFRTARIAGCRVIVNSAHPRTSASCYREHRAVARPDADIIAVVLCLAAFGQCSFASGSTHIWH